MRNIIVLGLVIINFAVITTSCNSEEKEAEAMLEGVQTFEETKAEFEDELLVDTVEMAKMDSAINANMQQPIVANRAAVEKSLKPNKDGVVVLDWNVMNDIKLEECFNEDIGEYFYCPEFGSIMKSLQGKKVALKGYVLPLDGGYFVLSMNPMASCYFVAAAVRSLSWI
ncbi:MAG: hypothetical protein HC803_03055 [Saprospiraceae bacterium]|nr:hypothetical protein [Saprospiraceae bacterium]